MVIVFVWLVCWYFVCVNGVTEGINRMVIYLDWSVVALFSCFLIPYVAFDLAD